MLTIRFNYVVKKQEQQKICFGSGKSRDLGLKSGMNTFMRLYTGENFPNIGPGTYNVIDSFKAISSRPCSNSFSKKGYGGLTNTSCRRTHTEDNPAPNEYNIMSALTTNDNKFRYPFVSKTKRKTFEINSNPGPATYQTVTPHKRKILLFDHDFGHNIKMRLPVEIKCTKRNVDTCDICNEKPYGDYWHLDDRVFVCRLCMTQERKKHLKYKKEELNKFRKIRDCSYIHYHEGTDAKIWRMHPKDVQKWGQREAYICQYIND